MTSSRLTVRQAVTFEGVGLHSGLPVKLTIEPANKAIRFHTPQGTITACPDEVTDTSRCTRLGSLSTVEHMMAALAGAGVTDTDIVVSADEMPALDGASQTYFEGITASGFENIGELEVTGLFTRVFQVEGNAKIAISKGEGLWRYEFVNEDHWPFEQCFEAHAVQIQFEKDIAPARTWGFEHELEAIQAAGLARGLNLENALVIGNDNYMNEARFHDEPARHKLLDCIGDLYLSGIPIAMLNVVGTRSGHSLNVQAAALLSESVQIERR